jgi:N-acetylglutamate synthase-like GNAT family acetyltransferase
MSGITVRPAVSFEREPLEAIQRRASLNNPGDRDALLANPDAIMLPLQQIVEGRVFVAERQGTILGFSVILPREDGNSELDGLFVEPECWRQGIGRALIEHSVRTAKNLGSRYLYVIGNTHAKDFYVACGFMTIGSERTQLGVGLLMKKALS